MNSSELKSLETRRKKLQDEVNVATAESNRLKQEAKKLQTQVQKLDSEIAALKKQSTGVVVSEHAILRYFEKVLHLDIPEATAKILPDTVKAQIAVLGNGKYPIPGTSFSIRVKNGTVVTLIPNDGT